MEANNSGNDRNNRTIKSHNIMYRCIDYIRDVQYGTITRRAIVIGTGIVTVPITFVYVLTKAGFTWSGIAAKSVASFLQSTLYGGATGGVFSFFQSLGARGIFRPVRLLINMVYWTWFGIRGLAALLGCGVFALLSIKGAFLGLGLVGFVSYGYYANNRRNRLENRITYI